MSSHVDPRVCCQFCFKHGSKLVTATRIAPQHSGGDEDRPATWVPVCDPHHEHWYDDIDEERILPTFVIGERGDDDE